MAYITKPRNTRHRKRLEGLDIIKKLKPPKIYENNPLWRRITEPEDFNEIFPTVFHLDFESDPEAWAVYVHVTDIAYSTGIYEDMKSSVIDQLPDGVELKIYKAKIDVDSLSFFELTHYLLEKEGIVVGFDVDTGEVELIVDEGLKGISWTDITRPNVRLFLKDKAMLVKGNKDEMTARIEDAGFSIVDVAQFLSDLEQEE